MTSRHLCSLMFSAAIVCSVGSVADAGTMNYVGNWSNTAVYKPGSVVVYNKAIYYSLKSTKAAPNKNQIPSSNPTWWQQVGTVGNTILNGVVNPTDPSMGQVGDFYLNTATNTLFGPKSAISPYWPAEGVSLVGSGGDSGTQGPIGATGPQGPTGLAGPTGPAGSNGLDGATGPQGPTGVAGPTGPAGSNGLDGATGPQGPTGVAGAAGPQGAVGPAGPTGDRGPAGPTPPPTLTVSVDCGNGGNIQQAIDNVLGGTVATINVSGACIENINVARGKTIYLVGSNGTSLTPLNDTSPAILVRGELTVQGFDISNTTGSADELVTAQTGSITIIGSRLVGSSVGAVFGIYNNSFGGVYNSEITTGTGAAIDSWGGSIIHVRGTPDVAAGPNGYATNISTTSGFAAVTCNSGGSIYARAVTNANGTGSVSIGGGQRGIYSVGCSLSLLNFTSSASNLSFSGSDTALTLMNSTMSLNNSQIANSGGGISAINSSLDVNQTTISNSSGNGISLRNSTAQLEASSITNSGERVFTQVAAI